MLVTKKTDAKGRLTLGAAYANVTVLIEKQRSGTVLIKKAAIISESKMRQLHKTNFLAKAKHQQEAIEDIKKLRGVVKGIDTSVSRDKDRV